jgi:four helix bundle protein
MAESIQQLRIYLSARELEDRIYELVKGLPTNDQFPLGNDLRRSSSAVSHYINEAHRQYSYSQKLESLAAARTAAEQTQRHLADCNDIEAAAICADYIGVVKQAWGLMKYLKTRHTERLARNAVRAKDEQVAART